MEIFISLAIILGILAMALWINKVSSNFILGHHAIHFAFKLHVELLGVIDRELIAVIDVI